MKKYVLTIPFLKREWKSLIFSSKSTQTSSVTTISLQIIGCVIITIHLEILIQILILSKVCLKSVLFHINCNTLWDILDKPQPR